MAGGHIICWLSVLCYSIWFNQFVTMKFFYKSNYKEDVGKPIVVECGRQSSGFPVGERILLSPNFPTSDNPLESAHIVRALHSPEAGLQCLLERDIPASFHVYSHSSSLQDLPRGFTLKVSLQYKCE